MSANTGSLYANAELALAAYANLTSNSPTNLSSNIDALKQAGMSAKQAEEFAKKYTQVLTSYHDTSTSFDATVFKDAAGNLTLAIRGTQESGDFLPTAIGVAIGVSAIGVPLGSVPLECHWGQRHLVF